MKKIFLTGILSISLFSYGQIIDQNINKTQGTISDNINDIDSIRFNVTNNQMEVIFTNGSTNSHQISDITDVDFTVIPCNPPDAPTVNAGINPTPTNFDANWTAVSNVTDYYLDVATDANFTNFLSGFNNLNVGNVLIYTVTGLDCNTDYYYRVRAENACGTSSDSNVEQVTINPFPSTPTANAGSNINATDFDANWFVANGATGYYLDVSDDAGFNNLVVNNQNVGNVTTYNVSGLTCGTTYYYRVRAENGCGISSNSSNVTVTTGVCPFSCGDPINGLVTFNYKGSSVTYGTINGQNGTCWLDRNLGASQVAVSSTDINAYGDLFQWGRGDDNHQDRNSPNQSGTSANDSPGHGNFLTVSSYPYDWHNPQNDNLWQGVNGANNPCPSGWRVPTETELGNERASWSTQNPAGAFGSPLKLPVAGARGGSDGSLLSVGSSGNYWASTVSGAYTRFLYFYSSGASMDNNNRANGYSVRCLKD